MRKLILNGGDRRINHWRVAVYLAGIVVVRFHVRIVAWVVIIRIIVVRIVRIVVPGEEPIIQPTPEAIDKDEEAMMIKVCMPPVPATDGGPAERITALPPGRMPPPPGWPPPPPINPPPPPSPP